MRVYKAYRFKTTTAAVCSVKKTAYLSLCLEMMSVSRWFSYHAQHLDYFAVLEIDAVLKIEKLCKC